MPDSDLIERTRKQMMRRFERADRRKYQVHERVRHHDDPVLIADDFAAFMYEIKNIVHDFQRYAFQAGLTDGTKGSGKRLRKKLNEWRDANLTPEEGRAWDQLRRLRDVEVHEAPIDPPTMVMWGEPEPFLDGKTFQRGGLCVAIGGVGNVPLIPLGNLGRRAAKAFIERFDRIS
jgi:hypothetical protein